MLTELPQYLPNDIVLHDVVRSSRRFKVRHECSSRDYHFVLPASFLIPFSQEYPTHLQEQIRAMSGESPSDLLKIVPDQATMDVAEELARLKFANIAEVESQLNMLMSHMVGNHSFHNFIIKRHLKKQYVTRYNAFKSLRRQIISFKVHSIDSDKVSLSVEGHSFGYGQIRRMVGLLSEIMFFQRLNPDQHTIVSEGA